TAIVREDRDRRAPEAIGELFEENYFFCSLHLFPQLAAGLSAFASTGTPGPIVEDSVALSTYWPFELAGFARSKLATTACAFSSSFAAPNDTLPTGTCRLPALSTRYSTWPALRLRTTFATSIVTVPT